MLTQTQATLLHDAIFAETDPAFVELRNAGATGAMAEWYSATATPDFLVWRTDAPVSDITNAISLDKYTPNDAPDGTTTWTNRVLAAQTKQLNIQLLLQGKTSIDASKTTVRAGLRDAVISVPTGAAGANTNPGGTSGVNVLNACTRKANRIEKLFSSGSETTGTVTASLLTYEGEVGNEAIVQAFYL